MDKIVYLQISSFDLVGGTHYYGSLVWRGPDGGDSHGIQRMEVEHEISSSDAAEMNRRDRGYTYHPGDRSVRFRSEEKLYQAAIALVAERWPDAILVRGSFSQSGPMPVLYGPPALVEKLRAIDEQAAKIGYWDRPKNDGKMARLTGQWNELINEWRGK